MRQTTKRTQSRAIPWFGSDCSVAEQYASLLSDCSWIGVPFCGGLSVVAHLVETAGEIVCNDKHTLAMNFYVVITDAVYRENLCEILRVTPFHESLLADCQDYCKMTDVDFNEPNVDAAFRYFVTCWMGRSGKAGTESEFNGGLAMRWDAGGGSSPLRFQTAVRSIQEVWGPICERCSFVCRDWSDVLSKVKDDPKCGLYVDPPWFVLGESYQHKFTEQDHRTLEEALHRFKKAKVVVRYGNHPDVWDLYRSENGWRITEIESRNQANSDVAELCITNW